MCIEASRSKKQEDQFALAFLLAFETHNPLSFTSGGRAMDENRAASLATLRALCPSRPTSRRTLRECVRQARIHAQTSEGRASEGGSRHDCSYRSDRFPRARI